MAAAGRVGCEGSQFNLRAEEAGASLVAALVQPVGEHQPGQVGVRLLADAGQERGFVGRHGETPRLGSRRPVQPTGNSARVRYTDREHPPDAAMTELVACPRCGDALDIPVELLGQPVRCAACRTVFSPTPTDAIPTAPRAMRPWTPPRTADAGDPAAKSNGWVWWSCCCWSACSAVSSSSAPASSGGC